MHMVACGSTTIISEKLFDVASWTNARTRVGVGTRVEDRSGKSDRYKVCTGVLVGSRLQFQANDAHTEYCTVFKSWPLNVGNDSSIQFPTYGKVPSEVDKVL